MLAKLVPMPLPTSVDLKTLVKSMKPSGVNLATPISKESGFAVASGVSWYGFGFGGAGAVDGRIPVRPATSPRPKGCAGRIESLEYLPLFLDRQPKRVDLFLLLG